MKQQKDFLTGDIIIISDTSCLISLSNTGLLDVLFRLANEVLVTPEVKNEYLVKSNGKTLPDWIKVTDYKNKELYRKIKIDSKLDKGEISAIVLALETKNSLLIIDEQKGRKYADEIGLLRTGTAYILFEAYKKGFIDDYEKCLNNLIDTGFRLDKSLAEDLIQAARIIKPKEKGFER